MDFVQLKPVKTSLPTPQLAFPLLTLTDVADATDPPSVMPHVVLSMLPLNVILPFAVTLPPKPGSRIVAEPADENANVIMTAITTPTAYFRILIPSFENITNARPAATPGDS